jgi:hypothetical protein
LSQADTLFKKLVADSLIISKQPPPHVELYEDRTSNKITEHWMPEFVIFNRENIASMTNLKRAKNGIKNFFIGSGGKNNFYFSKVNK